MSAAFGTVKRATRPATETTIVLKDKFMIGLALCEEIELNASIIATTDDGKKFMRKFFDFLTKFRFALPTEHRDAKTYTLWDSHDTAQEEANFFANVMEKKSVSMYTDDFVAKKYSRSQIILKDDEQVPAKYQSQCIVVEFDFSDQAFDINNKIVAKFFTTSDDNTIFAIVYLITTTYVYPDSSLSAEIPEYATAEITSRFNITFTL